MTDSPRVARRPAGAFGIPGDSNSTTCGEILKHIDRVIQDHPDAWKKALTRRQRERLAVIRTLYAQQREMYESNSNRINDRIVSLSQPWVRLVLSGESKTHSGALFFMTSFAPLCRTSSKIFPASPLLNREIGTVFSMAPRMEFMAHTSLQLLYGADCET